MKPFAVKELAEHLDEVLDIVKEGETIDVVKDGKVVARVVSPSEIKPLDKKEVEEFLAIMDRIADEVSSHITGPVDAVEIVRDVRE